METKQDILLGSFDLIMKYGIRSVSMDDIAQHCGVSKKTIYRSIENKEQLVSEVLENYIESESRTIESMTKNSKNALEEMILLARHIVKFFRSMKPSLVFDLQKYYPHLWKILEDKYFTFIHTTIINNLNRGIKEGLYNKDIDSGIIGRIYVHKMLAITDEDIFPLDKYSRAELFQSLIMYHIRGVISEKGRKVLKELEIE